MPSQKIAIWTLEDEKKGHVESIPHEEHGGPESVFDPIDDRRELVNKRLFEDGGKYRAVVKVQSLWQNDTWTMGTGWLIRDDLLVTAGHNVFSDSYGDQALRIKCWVGYYGRESVNEKSVQHTTALNVATTESWYLKKKERIHDLAFIQVREPFTGNLELFDYQITPESLAPGILEVVGYPGDYPKDGEDIGGRMYKGWKNTTYDLNKTKDHMIEYKIDTYGGQSGAPILFFAEDKVTAIGTHCYGAGTRTSEFNSGNPIGGQYGNDYDAFKNVFKRDNKGKPEALGPTRQVKIVDPPTTRPPPGTDEESFWEVFNKVAKIGSVALPFAGSFLGPIGTLVGTAAGGVLGALGSAESLQTPSDKVQEQAADRALLAEAALQSVIRLGRSAESDEVFRKMKEIWVENRIEGVVKLDHLLSPMLMDCALHITSEKWKNRADPDPSSMKLHPKATVEFDKEEDTVDSDKAQFIKELLGETRVVENSEESIEEHQESIRTWLGPLMRTAIINAKPLAAKAARKALDLIIKKLEGGGAESIVEDPPVQGGAAELLERAILADCALQAIEKLPKDRIEKLKLFPNEAGDEEGIIDAIKTRAQKIGPKVFHYGLQAIKDYLPSLLRELRKRDDHQQKTTNTTTALRNISAKNINWSNDHDHNPDAPLPEPEPPASPTPSNPDAPPREPEPPLSPVRK